MKNLAFWSTALLVAASAVACGHSDGSNSSNAATNQAALDNAQAGSGGASAIGNVTPRDVSLHRLEKALNDSSVALSADQKSAIDAFITAEKADRDAVKAAHADLLSTLATQVESGALDAAALQTKNDAVANAHKQLVSNDRSRFEKVHELLDASQRSAFVAAFEKDETRHQKRGGKHGERNGDPKDNGEGRGEPEGREAQGPHERPAPNNDGAGERPEPRDGGAGEHRGAHEAGDGRGPGGPGHEWLADLQLTDAQKAVLEQVRSQLASTASAGAAGAPDAPLPDNHRGPKGGHPHAEEDWSAILAAFATDSFSLDTVAPLPTPPASPPGAGAPFEKELEALVPVLTAEQRASLAGKIREQASKPAPFKG